jgi:hypothetical protein
VEHDRDRNHHSGFLTPLGNELAGLGFNLLHTQLKTRILGLLLLEVMHGTAVAVVLRERIANRYEND